MPDKKISQLTPAGALSGTEPLPIVQGGSTVKTTVQDIANLAVEPPGGNDTEIQYNSSNTFAGSPTFKFVYASQSLQHGFNVTATGVYSHAQGEGTSATRYASHAEGLNTTAASSASHAEGQATQANGFASHAEGLFSQANGVY